MRGRIVAGALAVVLTATGCTDPAAGLAAEGAVDAVLTLFADARDGRAAEVEAELRGVDFGPEVMSAADFIEAFVGAEHEARTRWQVRDHRVAGERAFVRVALADGPGGSEFELARRDGRWRIVAVRAAVVDTEGEVVLDVVDDGDDASVTPNSIRARERFIARVRNDADVARVCEIHALGGRSLQRLARELATSDVGFETRRAGLPPVPAESTLGARGLPVFGDGLEAGRYAIVCFAFEQPPPRPTLVELVVTP